MTRTGTGFNRKCIPLYKSHTTSSLSSLTSKREATICRLTIRCSGQLKASRLFHLPLNSGVSDADRQIRLKDMDIPALSPDDVVQFMHEFEEAASHENFSLIADKIHDEAVFRFTDGDFSGIQSVRGAFEKTWALDTEDERYYLTNIQVLSTDAKSATATYTYNWEGKVDGRPFQTRGRGTRVMVLDGGSWKIIHEHLSHFPKSA